MIIAPASQSTLTFQSAVPSHKVQGKPSSRKGFIGYRSRTSHCSQSSQPPPAVFEGVPPPPRLGELELLWVRFEAKPGRDVGPLGSRVTFAFCCGSGLGVFAPCAAAPLSSFPNILSLASWYLCSLSFIVSADVDVDVGAGVGEGEVVTGRLRIFILGMLSKTPWGGRGAAGVEEGRERIKDGIAVLGFAFLSIMDQLRVAR